MKRSRSEKKKKKTKKITKTLIVKFFTTYHLIYPTLYEMIKSIKTFDKNLFLKEYEELPISLEIQNKINEYQDIRHQLSLEKRRKKRRLFQEEKTAKEKREREEEEKEQKLLIEIARREWQYLLTKYCNSKINLVGLRIPRQYFESSVPKETLIKLKLISRSSSSSPTLNNCQFEIIFDDKKEEEKFHLEPAMVDFALHDPDPPQAFPNFLLHSNNDFFMTTNTVPLYRIAFDPRLIYIILSTLLQAFENQHDVISIIHEYIKYDYNY